ncbi:uncharacterized protein LOC128548832 [Mercenaria mercenaria]|uniref:uncharacterized protein LOC128548832 n=1 Tax=Mercenaria mercenaria TaxID=6596 RepID=UPI00234E5932|nr:uncharacterized protein LOC128548832 [Mercenaria mercenaria]
MIPDPILDCSLEFKLFGFGKTRHIKENKGTLEKNREILRKVRSKGAVGYNSFKKCLINTKQMLLVELLECIENGEDTNVLENNLFYEKVKTKVVQEMPSAPKQLIISEVTSESCQLHWQKPESNGGSSIKGYLVQMREANKTDWIDASTSVSTHIVISSLKRKRQYLFRVAAENEYLTGEFAEIVGPITTTDVEKLEEDFIDLYRKMCEEIEPGTCKYELCCQIVELLLKRSFEKHPDMQQSREQSMSDIPQCFSEHEHSKKHYLLLKALGQLAFETLFSETKASTLVFNQSMTEKHLTPENLKLSLASGLLTQSTEKTFTKQISKFSFSHETVKNFFCALYFSCQNESDVKEIFLKECKSLQRILDMSTVLVFISEMNEEIISSISRNFMSVISEDKRTSEYRTTSDEYCGPLKDIQDMYISCMKENTSNKELKICCQDFFFSEDCKEEKYFNHLTQLSVDNKNNMASININTDRVFGCGRSLREIIDCCDLVDPFSVNKIYYEGYGENALLPVLLNKSTKCLTVRSPFGSWSREMLETLQNNSQLQAIYILGSGETFTQSHSKNSRESERTENRV